MNKIGHEFIEKLITPVPLELKEQFDDIQLKNSIRRIKILALIAVVGKSINVIFSVIGGEYFRIEEILSLRECIELIIIAMFFVIIALFQKKDNKIVLWLICYLFIAGFYILYAHDLYNTEIVSHIVNTFFITVFLFAIVPDFRPRIFIPFSLSYYLMTVYILFSRNQEIGEYFGSISNTFNMFLIVLITKILLYNSKVKTFTANQKIEKQKNELKNYNENLEIMVQEKTKTIVELKNAVMETIAEMVERRDDSTGGHISRTSKYLRIFIDSMLKNGLYKEQTASWNVEQMVLSAQLHDVGKIAIDDSILRKPAKLTDEEFDKMKKHTIFGGEIIKEVQKKTGEREFLEYAYIFAVYHHEKWDGSGYPHGIVGENIPLPARLMAIIDVFDALISERPYKKPFSHEEAIKIIKDGEGSHFDPALTKLFLSVKLEL